jgi:hypothetical protein
MTSAVTGLAAVAAGPAPDMARMQSVIGELAGDGYAGRRVGTAGGRAAAGWLAGQLEATGTVARVEEFPVAGAVRDVYALPRLSWRDGDTAVELVFRRDFCEHLASADLSEPRTGRLAVAADADVSGAWVLDSAFSTDRITALAATGAVGIVVPRGTDAGGWMPKMIAGPAPAALPILAVRTDLHERMRSPVGRRRLTGAVPVRTVDVIGSNVYGVFRPRLAGLPVLLTAHFDGVGDDPDGTRFPAACDNAAGVAAVIEAARILNATLPAGVGLAVALLDGEEAGARGSAWHARFVDDGTFVINLDGAAQLAGAAAVEAGGAAQPLLAALDLAGRQVGVPLRAQAMPSDNRRYAAAGLPAVGVGMGMPGYQTPAETVDRVDPATLLAAARLVIATVVNLADGFNPTRSQS